MKEYTLDPAEASSRRIIESYVDSPVWKYLEKQRATPVVAAGGVGMW